MNDNLRPCPLCGKMPTIIRERVTCSTLGCLLQENIISVDSWNTRPIEDELNRRIAKAKNLLNIEMGQWRSVPTGNLPDHFIQLRQVLDVLDGGGE